MEFPTCQALLPGAIKILILIPVDLLAHRIPHHAVEVGGAIPCCVEELPPQQLPCGNGETRVADFLEGSNERAWTCQGS